MTDRELAVTGVPAEGFDPELEVTGVPSQAADAAVASIQATPVPALQGPGLPPVGPAQPSPVQPSFHPDRGGVVPAAYLTHSDAQAIQARLYMLDPALQYDPDRNAHLFDRLVTAIAEQPELRDLFWQDAELALSRSTDEYMMLQQIAAQVPGGETQYGPVSADLQAIVMGLMEHHDRQYGTVYNAGRLLSEMDVVRGAWESGAVQGAVSRLAAPEGASQLEQFATRRRFEQQITVDGEVIDLSTRDLQSLQGSAISAVERLQTVKWAYRDGNLALELGNDEGTTVHRTLIRLDPGTTIEDNADAARALLLAYSGTRHEVDPNSDPLLQPQAIMGTLIERGGDVVRFTERNGAAPVYRSIRNIVTGATTLPHLQYDTVTTNDGRELVLPRDEARAIEKEMTAARTAASPESAITAIADGLLAEGVETRPGDAIQRAQLVYAGLPLEDQTGLVAELADVDVEDALKRYREATRDQTELGRLFEDFARPATTAMLAWDQAVHNIGIFITDAALGVAGDVASGQITNPVQLFRDAFDEAVDNDYISDYFGMDNTTHGATWLNLGTSIVFDPLTWMTPGGKSGWKLLERSMADPALAPSFLRGRNQIRSIVNHVVDSTRRPQLLQALGTGIDPTDYARLVRIANTEFTTDAARDEALEQVWGILDNAVTTGTFVPTGPAAVHRRQAVEGLTRILREPELDDNAVDAIGQWLVKASPGRAVRIDADFFDDVTDLIAARFPRQGDEYADWVTRAADTWDASRGTQGELRAAIALRQETAARFVNDFKITDPNVSLVKRYRDQIIRMEDRLFEMRVAGEPADDIAKLQAAVDKIDQHIARYGPEYDQSMQALARAKREAFDLKTELDSLAYLEDRTVLDDFVKGFMDDWAEAAGVPKLPNGKFDWEVVGGRYAGAKFKTDTAGNNIHTAPFGDDISDTAARQAGLAARTRETVLPVSPLELIAWSSADPANWTKIANRFESLMSNTLVDNMQYLFASSVLLNGLTSVKAHIDEIVRFYQQTGRTGRSLAAFAGVKPASARAQSYVREMASLVPMRNTGWQLIENPQSTLNVAKKSRDFFKAAERWVNGSLLNMPTFRAYAQAVTRFDNLDDQLRWFTQEFWEKEGHQIAKQLTVTNKAVDAQTAWKTVSNGLDAIVSSAVKNGDQLRAELIAASAGGRNVAPQALRWMGAVPMQTSSGRGLGGALLEAAFGAPSQRRGSVFFDYYYGWHYGVLQKRLADNVLSPDMLVKAKLAEDLDDAHFLLARGRDSSQVRQFMATSKAPNGGRWYLPGDLENISARWAAQRSDDLMYSIGATSVFGKRLARLYPFGRAQVDFIDYWWRQLTSPTQLRFGQNLVDVPGMPLNLRLLSRMSHIAGAADDDNTEDVVGAPSWLRKYTTFLPGKFDEEFIMDNAPGLGPLPSWAINFIPPEGHVLSPFRQTLDFFHPSRQIFADYTNTDLASSAGNLFDAVIPPDGRGARHTLTAAVAAIGAQLGFSKETLNTLYSVGSIGGEPPFLRDHLAQLQADWFAETNEYGVPNAFSYIGSDVESSPALEQLDVMETQATRSAMSRQGIEVLRRHVGFPSQYGSDQLYARSYAGLAEVVDEWEENGWITASWAEQFRLRFDAIRDWIAEEGDAPSLDAIKAFGDIAGDILNSELLPRGERALFVVRHPEIAVNFVGNWQVDPGATIPEKYRSAVAGTELLLFGEAGREAWEAGRDQGWIVPRENDAVFVDRMRRLSRFAGDALRYLWDAEGFGAGAGVTWAKGRLNQAEAATTLRLPADWVGHEILERLSPEFVFPDEWRQGDGSIVATRGQLKDHFSAMIDQIPSGFTYDNTAEAALNRLAPTNAKPANEVKAAADRLGWDLQWDETTDINFYGRGLVESLNQDTDFFERAFGWRNPSEWDDIPAGTSVTVGDRTVTFNEGLTGDQLREAYRQRFRVAVLLNKNFDEGTYNKYYSWAFGPLDWEPPRPPEDITELDNYTFTSDPLAVNVIDGDTISFTSERGDELIFRIVGINAPERGQEGYDQASLGLRKFLDGAEEVGFGVFQPELYGTTQSFLQGDGPGGAIVARERVFAWLYVDGVPIYDASVFSATNPRGVSVTSSVLDFNQFRQVGD